MHHGQSVQEAIELLESQFKCISEQLIACFAQIADLESRVYSDLAVQEKAIGELEAHPALNAKDQTEPTEEHIEKLSGELAALEVPFKAPELSDHPVKLGQEVEIIQHVEPEIPPTEAA